MERSRKRGSTEVLATIKVGHAYASLLKTDGALGLCLLATMPVDGAGRHYGGDLIPVSIAKALIQVAEASDAGA